MGYPYGGERGDQVFQIGLDPRLRGDERKLYREGIEMAVLSDEQSMLRDAA
jgi:hypothetical protein